MKRLSLIFAALLGVATAFAGPVNKTFKVYGNCGMCEKTIEKAALSVEGVSKADWNKDSKKMEVTYHDAKTNLEKIHEAIAESGYDTELKTASDDAYNNLHSCCQYKRKAETKE